MTIDTDIKLYGYYRSSAVYRVRIALELKHLRWQQIQVNLLEGEQRQAAYMQLNPQGLVPALATSEGLITQSLTISEYLEEKYPQSPLLPSTAIDRACVRSMAQQIAMEIHPLNNPRVTQFLIAELGVDEEAKLQWYRHWIALGFTALEQRLQSTGSNGQYCFGDTATMADVCLIPQVYNAQRFDCPLEDYPLIRSINDHCTALPEFIAASPESIQQAGG